MKFLRKYHFFHAIETIIPKHMLSVKQQYRNLTASAHGEEAQTTFEDTGSMNVLRIQKTDSITRAACGPPGLQEERSWQRWKRK
jgi:hypothetical protein